MNQIATITSKKQLTLPAKLFTRVGFKVGQKVIVSEENGSLKITPAEGLVSELAGSVAVPARWKGQDVDKIIEQARQEYLQNKHSLK